MSGSGGAAATGGRSKPTPTRCFPGRDLSQPRSREAIKAGFAFRKQRLQQLHLNPGARGPPTTSPGCILVPMKSATRRQMLEKCIVRGGLVAGAAMSESQLLAFWEEGEKIARKPTPSEVLGPFFKKGAPNVSALRQPGAP